MNLTLLTHLLSKLGITTVKNSPVVLAGSRALTSDDNQAKLQWQSAAADCAITVPADLPDGFACDFLQLDAHPITFAAGAGAAVHNLNNYTKTGGQWAVMTLRKVGVSTYVLTGSGSV